MSTKKTIVLLAGGFGSRYQGLKQIDGILENDATLMEYSIYDAIEAGFNKIVFIINDKIPTSFLGKINSIFQDKNIEIHWVYQTLETALPLDFSLENRVKPWGTAHAVLCAKEVVSEPFIVLNADDFYGKFTFQKAALLINQDQINEDTYCLLAYPVQNTLSENGGVSRGVCSIDNDGFLKKIEEKTHILRKNNQIIFQENGSDYPLKEHSLVSMNFWIFHPSIFENLEYQFKNFIKNYQGQEEFYIPTAVQNMMDHNNLKVLVKASPAEWMGVTYPNDKPLLQEFLREKINQNQYPELLWNN